MKRIFTSIVVLFIGSLSLAQGYTISPSNTVSQTIYVGGYYTATIDLPHDNLSNDTVTIGWEIISIDVPVGENWDYSYCDYTSCYGGNITSSSMTPIMNGEAAFFKVNLMAPTVGVGEWVVKVFNIDNPGDSDTLTYIFDAIVGLDELASASVTVSPNPNAGNEINFHGLLTDTEISVINSLGQKVASSNYTGQSGNFTMNNLGLKRGLYFVHFDKDGKSYSTRKLIVK